MPRPSLIISIVLLFLMCGVTLADTLYLRNGSVLQGTFVGYENGYFLFRLSTGDERAEPQRILAREVVRLVMDRTTTGSPVASVPPDRTRPTFESFPQVDVRLMDQWVRSGVEVKSGQQVRVEASGTMNLDRRTRSTPDGINRRDPDAPLPDANDGALVAAIGTDPSSPVILLGRYKEFTADRDGELYFTVNHWDIAEANGSYQVRVSVDRSGTNSGGNVASQYRDWRERNLTIRASNQWTDAGIDVEPGMAVEITADGTIGVSRDRRTDANGDASGRNSSSLPVSNAGTGALLAKIRYRNGGESNIVVVGTSRSLIIDPGEYGRLWLGINDDYTRDNSGSFNVKVRYATR